MATTTGHSILKQSSYSLKDKIERTKAQELEKQVKQIQIERAEQKQSLIAIRERILANNSERLELRYKEIIKINKDINFFSQEIGRGEKYQENIQRIAHFRIRKQKLIRELIKASKTVEPTRQPKRITRPARATNKNKKQATGKNTGHKGTKRTGRKIQKKQLVENTHQRTTKSP